MASQLQLRGGTTAEHGSFTGAIRELTVDTTLKALRLHDGVTAGGTVIAGLSDVQALITALSDTTVASVASEASTRASALANLTTLINSANADRVTEDTQIKADFAAGDVAAIASANAYADTKIAEVLGGAPELLDTLNELATAIGDDANFITTLTTSIGAETTARGAADTVLQTAIDLRATIDNPTFTTKINSPEFHSAGGHLKFKGSTNDIMFYPNNIETLQITRNSSTGHPTFTANGGSGEFKFNQSVDLADGFKVGGVAITADAAEINYLDGVTSSIQTQLDAEAAARAAADTANLATAQAFATAAVADVIDASPAALNTLNEIAAAIGDDSDFITTISANVTAVQTDVNANEVTAAAATAAVQADVDANETAINASLSTETSARTSADSALSARLDTAEGKSSYTDPTTQTLLTAETTARTAADSALSGRLDTAEAKSSYSDPTTQTLLTAETTARTSADTALSGRLDTLEADDTTQTLLTAEATTRASADTALSARLDTAEAKTSYSDPTTQTLLTAETTARTSADSALSARLNTAEGKSSYSDPTTQTLLTAEATTRSNADTALSARLDTAEAKSSYSDPTTQTLLSAEATTRAAAVITLQTNIDTITTARTVDEERHLQAGLATGYLYVSNFSGG